VIRALPMFGPVIFLFFIFECMGLEC